MSVSNSAKILLLKAEILLIDASLKLARNKGIDARSGHGNVDPAHRVASDIVRELEQSRAEAVRKLHELGA